MVPSVFAQLTDWPVCTGNWPSTRLRSQLDAGRTERGAGPGDPGGSGQVPEQVRVIGVEPAAPARTEPGLGLPQPLRQRTVRRQRQAVPGQLGFPGEHLDRRPVLVQERSRLERRLARPHHQHFLVAEGRQVAVLGGVRAGPGRQGREWLGNMGEMLDTRGHHHLAGPHSLGAAQGELKPVRPGGNIADEDFFEVGQELRAEPLTVLDKGAQRYRQAIAGVRLAGGLAELLQRVCSRAGPTG